jgi:hypothetical protein
MPCYHPPMRRILAPAIAVILVVYGCAKNPATDSSAPDRPGASYAAAAPRNAIDLELSVTQDLSAVDGTMTLHYVNQEPGPVDRVRFLRFPDLVGGRMQIATCTVDGAPVATGDGPVASVSLPRTLATGESADLACAWRTTVPRVEGGGPLARSDGFASLAWCFPVPVSPRTGTDLPAPYADWLCTDAALWRVRISLPAGMLLVAAGTETGRTGVDGRTVVDLVLDPARDFYLAVGSGLVEQPARQLSGRGPVVRCLAPPGREAAAAFAAEAAAKAIDIFSRRFGPYPYGSFTILCGPLASLGIEFPGLTVIGEAIFTLAGAIGGVSARAMLEATVVHEVAHQWFYNLVGNDQAAEPWLDEAVAQYATRLYYLDRYSEAAADSYAESWATRWDRVARATTPVGMPVSAYPAVEYGAIVYGRGPIFLETLAASLGGKTFDRFLLNYVERFAWRIARGTDFLAMAEEACGCDREALFAAWVWKR